MEAIDTEITKTEVKDITSKKKSTSFSKVKRDKYIANVRLQKESCNGGHPLWKSGSGICTTAAFLHPPQLLQYDIITLLGGFAF